MDVSNTANNGNRSAAPNPDTGGQPSMHTDRGQPRQPTQNQAHGHPIPLRERLHRGRDRHSQVLPDTTNASRHHDQDDAQANLHKTSKQNHRRRDEIYKTKLLS